MTEITGGNWTGSHTDDYTTWDAPYVLGSLSRDERREYEDHLAGCPDCAGAVSELAGLPGMLSLVDADTALTMIEAPDQFAAPDVPPVPELLPRLADAAERRRRRTRWTAIGGAVVAAAAAVAISVPIVSSVTSTSDQVGTDQVVFAERSMEPLEPTPVSADVKIVTSEGRTRVVMTCRYAPADYSYTWNFGLTVNSKDGRKFDLDQWPAGPGTILTVDRTVDLPPDQITSVQIKSISTGRVVLNASV
ncbi:anti-sigma factor family protein [Nocardia bovistercoris]|uniref:Zf-HC2 domain-containing protein n=1 Tax=Nocardia bovistercoris TaxID=2785916 RepID=A0A931N1Q8_9NOCA|nr:zf-HC2 domain-containing protein [Nocardia bovistercoris]MBH0778670.1 zf-HC2 domain-containing protein [Nocardia bovistercoris]